MLMLVCFLMLGLRAQAEDAVIQPGIYADRIELSGLTREQATSAIESYVEKLKSMKIILIAAGGNEVALTAGDIGLVWANPEIVEEAAELGVHGNVIERYKALKDLEHENRVFPIELSFDIHAINEVLVKRCAVYDQQAVRPSLKRTDGVFEVIEGKTGYVLDIETSIDIVYNFLVREWDRTPCRIDLDVVVDHPKGSAEELAQITDVLGTFTTSYSSSGSSRRGNVENGCSHVNGILLYPGEEFSMYQTVSPFTSENGYYMAGSYLNGKVVDSLGGGICQVSTTLYNAVLLAELEVTERHNHSMIVSYVEPSADAAIAESSGKDFKFRNNTEYPIYIEGITAKRKITFNIYGKETRNSNRQVRYESEVLETTVPPADLIYPDATQPIGYIVADSAHIGYKAKLWKVVTEDGVEVSRTEVNSSKYKMVPRSATVGTATSDPHAYEEIMAAIGTGSVDHVKAVISLLTSQAASNSVEIGEQ